MADKRLRLEIVTPQRHLAYEEVVSCSAPGVLGYFQILPDHTEFVSELTIGEIKVEFSDHTKFFATTGGFLEVVNNRVLLLLEACEAAEEIDIDRALRALERAKRRLQEQSPDVDLMRARAALLRATNRLKIAQKLSLAV
ncbi:MAG: F0F1 ATP synthase subunit epsilon [Calditrichaeota bacterium]|nr:MAG: F0F1 ATP synthase subunit epsilon [Calditrichota bacterium]